MRIVGKWTVIWAAAWLLAGCGLMGGPCNAFCEMQIECAQEDDCGNDVDESDMGRCVDACKSASDELSDKEAKVFEKCTECAQLLDEDDRCDDLNAECDECAELVSGAEEFWEDFFDDFSTGYCYDYYDY